jgi:DNA-binding SARP family transcriptional activator
MRRTNPATTADIGHRPSVSPARPVQHHGIQIRVLGRFEVCAPHTITVGTSCQRLITLLAVKDGQINRAAAAGTLWPEVIASRANANLRSVLWRLQRCCPGLIEATFQDLRLPPSVSVDIQEVSRVARQLLNRSVIQDPDGLSQALECNLNDDIAPDLSDEWLTAERERYCQFRMHALESLTEQLIAAGWYGAAVEAALRVARADPFRESAYTLLIRAHLRKGNRIEAYRKHREYCDRVRDELGLEPSRAFQQLFLSSAEASYPGEYSAMTR